MGLPQDLIMDETIVTVPYPAKTKQAAADINGVKTEVLSMSFSDKIMITITQEGRLAQWVTVPLLSDNPTQADPFFHTLRSDDDALLPASRFAPRTLLGAANSEREVMGQLFASQIAHAITTKNSEEGRPLLLGLGLAKVEEDRDVFLKVIDLVLQVL